MEKPTTPDLQRIRLLLSETAHSMYRDPTNAAQHLITLQKQSSNLAFLDHNEMLSLPGVILHLDGDTIRRQQTAEGGSQIVIQGGAPDTLIDTKIYTVVSPKIRETRTGKLIQPLIVKSRDDLDLSQTRRIEIEATEDIFLMIDPTTI